MKILDRLCAGAIFMIAIVDCLLVPKTYTGRIWIFGSGLALLFTAMFNWLRIRAGDARNVRLFCLTANVTMTVLAAALIASVGRARALANAQVPFIGFLLLAETIFSLRKNV
jgi:hypothetical protein